MARRIWDVRISQRSLSPVEADLLIEVDVDAASPDFEIRGGLVGPTCAYSSTIEINYPVRSLPRESKTAPLRGRIVIPEPSWWDPISPFLYHGRIELWRNGHCLVRPKIRHGLRSVQLKPEGLFWNGKKLLLRAVDRQVRESDLPELRKQGVNALILSADSGGVGPAEPSNPPIAKGGVGPADISLLCPAAERLGFVIVARVARPDPPDRALTTSPALLGWILPPDWVQHPDAWSDWLAANSGGLFAVENAGEIHFIADLNNTDRTLRLLRNADGELGRIVD